MVSMIQQAHHLVQTVVRPDDVVIDATAGNGYDSLFLSKQLNESGHLIVIDIQPQAIENTRQRLDQAGVTNFSTSLGNHAEQLSLLIDHYRGRVGAIMFNLGYLPGSDKTVLTTPTNTLKALDASFQLLRPHGVLCVVAYRGHPGGKEEATAVEDWFHSQSDLNVSLAPTLPPQSVESPVLFALTKMDRSE